MENMSAKEDRQFSHFLLDLMNVTLQRESIAQIKLPTHLNAILEDYKGRISKLTSIILPEL